MPLPSTARAEKPRTADQVIQKFGRTMLSTEIELQLVAALQKSCSPHLKDEICVYKRLEGRLEKKYGDYMCYNILRICEILRSKDPKRFKHTSPKTIAKEIMANFEKSEMIRRLTLVDIGFLTFRLNGDWMVKRIQKNLKDGIVAWAPITHVRRAIVDSPVQDIEAEKHADGVRDLYIRDTLVRMLEYSGVEVSGRMRNEESLHAVKTHFPEEGGVIRKKGKSEPLFEIKEEASRKTQPNNVHEDLAALWCGIYVQKADWIVYVTPVRQRDYIRKCFSAAKDFKEDHPTMSYVGYQTSSDEQGKLTLVRNLFESWHKKLDRFDIYVKEGYSPEALYECLIRYAHLKTHRYSDCALIVEEEMRYNRENTFVYLLETQTRIRAALKNSRPNLKSNKALVVRERERKLGLHLLQFTEVTQEAFLTAMPHLLCEYLLILAKNFTSYIHEDQPSETRFLLCKTAEAVMDKGFDLLGLTPESSKGLPSYLKRKSGKDTAVRDHYISLPVSSLNPSSRFELFSMFVGVNHSNFEMGELFGNITLSDTCGLLSDGWCTFDENDCGHVAHFAHDFDNSIGIRDTSFLSFGNPGSRHSVPFCDSIEMGVHLYVTTKRKDACYELCSCDTEIKLSSFWHGKESIERSTFYAEGNHGCVSIYYILLKDAVDTYWRLTYEPTNGVPKLRGHIVAYYGDDALDGCVSYNKSYEAVMFHIKPSKLEESDNLKLKRSALAVPANGVLMINAVLEDVDSGEFIVNGTLKYPVKPEADSIEWPMEGKNCRFKLIVDLTYSGGQKLQLR